ncbi:hypothetical protein [Paramagnetospirillum caucaseum]|nr:hypothetical protein [Paramagnetospirillum caucaseum]
MLPLLLAALMLRLSSKFGSENQKDQNIVLRLSGRGESIEAGTLGKGISP